jgi:hypothetical protein
MCIPMAFMCIPMAFGNKAILNAAVAVGRHPGWQARELWGRVSGYECLVRHACVRYRAGRIST